MGTWWTGEEWQTEKQTHIEALRNSCGGFTISDNGEKPVNGEKVDSKILQQRVC